MFKLSTTFHVYPGNRHIPSLGEVLELTHAQLSRYLSSIGIRKQFSIVVQLHEIESHRKVDFNPTDKMTWDEKCYAWFFVHDIQGGTDVYFNRNQPSEFEIWEDEISTNPNAKKMKDKIRASLEIGHHWNFRRSAGQPAIIALSYGLLAASVAKLTDGFIYSDDGAWDYAMFPAKSDDFFNWYFNPNLALSENDRDFSRQCINSIIAEFGANASIKLE